ncbi:MAG TPA: ABC transporter permease, partial [Arenimonas sp.]|nr:ABC transporter permease [Arenimonas sp.]
MKASLTVFMKEVVENLRDRKTVMNALVMGPLLGPILFAVLMGFVINKQLDSAEKPLEVPVVGVKHAPNLVAWLRRQGVVIEEEIPNPEDAIRERQAKVVLRIPADFGEYWREGRTARVEVLYDSSDQDARTPQARLVGLLEAYGRQQSALRITARGLHPAILQPLSVASHDLASRQQ